MPLQVEWYVPLRAVDARFQGRVTTLEMGVLAERFIDLLSEAEQQVPGRKIYLLFDTMDAESMPPMYSMLTQGMPVIRFKNRGAAFHVTRNRVIRKMLEVTAHVTEFKVYGFDNRADAVKALEAALALDEMREVHK